MASMGDHDFSNFLDLDLDTLSGFYPQHDGEKQQQQPDLTVSGDGSAQPAAIFGFQPAMDLQFNIANNVSLAPQGLIPTTPNSVELHADSVHYFQQQLEAQQRALIDQYNMGKADAAQFTPVRSPLEHPHDVHYTNNVSSNYTTIPGAYFSPLTSPALEGQSYAYATNPGVPIASGDLDPNLQDPTASQSALPRAKTRKRPTASRQTTTIARQKPSPALRPQRTKKNAAHPALQDDRMEIAETEPRPSQSQSPDSADLMGPPLHPASATQSPALAGQASGNALQSGPHATPASLMRMASRTSPREVPARSASAGHPGRVPLPPLTLPESAAPLSADELGDDSDVGSPSRKTPKFGPMSTPSETLRRSGSASGLASPLSAGVTGAKKLDPKGRSAKKRASVSNGNLVSPALRPKISPSIKPLLPEGAGTSDDSHTAFLTSRSNYQNLIDGTHLPGVLYPTELSTNLTSKRTSHKIAEQGRRNRINVALQEMLRLLPRTGSKPPPSADSLDSPKDDDGGKGGSKSNGNSKAATVESAIEYIKALKQESEDMSKVAEERDRECEELRKKVQAMEKLLSEKGVPASKK